MDQDLRTMQSIVGGYLEAVYMMHDQDGTPQVIMWCNEDGKLKDLPVNRRATAFWYALNGGSTGDSLCGTVILTGGADENGDILPVPGEVADLWKDIAPGPD
jgi:hypothetical protein